jgi:phosphoglycolate phosphatase-like HAD superfamily hydrolase
MNVALFDLDGCLANYELAMRTGLNAMRSPNEPEIDEETNLWEMEENHRYLKYRMDLLKTMPGFWSNLKVIQDGMQILHSASSMGFRINILTKASSSKPNAWKEKVEWCQQHIGTNIDINITSGQKGMVYGKFLYDDYPEYMLSWLKYRPRGLGIMPVNNQNKDFSHPNVIKYEEGNYWEVIDAMRSVYERKEGEALSIPE